MPPVDLTGIPDQPGGWLDSQAAPVLIGVLASPVVILAALAFTRRRSRD